jgi:hypothetical protein
VPEMRTRKMPRWRRAGAPQIIAARNEHEQATKGTIGIWKSATCVVHQRIARPSVAGILRNCMAGNRTGSDARWRGTISLFAHTERAELVAV